MSPGPCVGARGGRGLGLGLLGRICGSGKGVEQRVSLVRVRVCFVCVRMGVERGAGWCLVGRCVCAYGGWSMVSLVRVERGADVGGAGGRCGVTREIYLKPWSVGSR